MKHLGGVGLAGSLTDLRYGQRGGKTLAALINASINAAGGNSDGVRYPSLRKTVGLSSVILMATGLISLSRPGIGAERVAVGCTSICTRRNQQADAVAKPEVPPH